GRSEGLRGGYEGVTGAAACGQPAVGESDAITPAMPIFILSGIRNEMGVSAETAKNPDLQSAVSRICNPHSQPASNALIRKELTPLNALAWRGRRPAARRSSRSSNGRC